MSRMTAGQHSPGRSKLADSALQGEGSELFVVEGDSALASVCAVRSERRQGVVAFQGKPLNAWYGSAERVDDHAQYRLLAQALGLVRASVPQPQPVLNRLRYGRVVLLLDPDADGIHIAALLAMYFLRWQPAWVEAGRLLLVRAPMYEIVSADGEVQHADHPAQRDAVLAEMATLARSALPGPQGQQGQQGEQGQPVTEASPRVQAHRGLGSIRPSVLRERCVDAATRHAMALSAADIQAMVMAFSRGQRGA